MKNTLFVMGVLATGMATAADDANMAAIQSNVLNPHAVPAAIAAPQAEAPRSLLTPEERAFERQESALLRSIRLLQLQVEEHELKQSLQAKNEPRTSDLSPLAQPSVIDLPPQDPFHLVSIWGDGGQLQADLFVNGLRVTVRPGSVLPDGWSVAQVSDGGVQIRRGRESRTLTLGQVRRR